MSLGRQDTDKRFSFYHQLTQLSSAGAQQSSCVVTKQQQSARVRVNHNSQRNAALPGLGLCTPSYEEDDTANGIDSWMGSTNDNGTSHPGSLFTRMRFLLLKHV